VCGAGFRPTSQVFPPHDRFGIFLLDEPFWPVQSFVEHLPPLPRPYSPVFFFPCGIFLLGVFAPGARRLRLKIISSMSPPTNGPGQLSDFLFLSGRGCPCCRHSLLSFPARMFTFLFFPLLILGQILESSFRGALPLSPCRLNISTLCMGGYSLPHLFLLSLGFPFTHFPFSDFTHQLFVFFGPSNTDCPPGSFPPFIPLARSGVAHYPPFFFPPNLEIGFLLNHVDRSLL